MVKDGLKGFEKVRADFSQFFSQGNLKEMIDRKLNITDYQLMQIHNVKANDFDRLLDSVNNMYHKLKQVSVLQAEMARAILPMKASSSMKAGETTNTKLMRRDYVAKQAKITADWIMDTHLDTFISIDEFKKVVGQDQLPNMTKNFLRESSTRKSKMEKLWRSIDDTDPNRSINADFQNTQSFLVNSIESQNTGSNDDNHFNAVVTNSKALGSKNLLSQVNFTGDPFATAKRKLINPSV